MTMLKFFTSDLRRNITKIVCLTLGLAMGFLLIAKIVFDETFDTALPGSDRIYVAYESVSHNGEYWERAATPGAIAPGLKRYMPQVEASTRFTDISGSCGVKLADGRTVEAEGVSLNDNCFFDVFGTTILEGDPHEVLAIEGQCMIPRSLAERIGPDAVGQQTSVTNFSDDMLLRIGGIYEDFPLNTSLSNYIYLSLPTISWFMHDGTENWMGNDRYSSFARLAKGTTQEEIRPHIDRMLADNIDKEDLELYHFNINLKKLVGSYNSRSEVRTMLLVLSVLVVILLMASSLNYLLIVVGQMSHRSKEMAIRKCYGTSNLKIFGRVMGESLFFLVLSAALALLLIFCFSETSEKLLGYTTGQLLATPYVWRVEGAVCALLLVITGAVPAWIYCRTPVANAFRSNTRSRRGWKLALLAIQFFASGVVICLLSLIGRQYAMMSDIDMGFEYKNVARLTMSGLGAEKSMLIADEIRRLSCVEGAAFAEQDFTRGASGNNVWLDDERDRGREVNIADMYGASPEIVDVMGMKLLQGETFRPNADSLSRQVIVEERFIDVLRDHFGVTDSNIVGKTFKVTEHGFDGSSEFTICGVIGNIRRGGAANTDSRAGLLFPTKGHEPFLYVRFNHLDEASMHQAQEAINRLLPDEERYLLPMQTCIDLLNRPVKRFGTSVMIVGIVVVVIALIGLTGYTTDEVERRAKEIAIRKVTGYESTQIVRLFCLDIMKVAVPSLLAGGAVAVIIGQRWLSQFTERVTLSPLIMALCIVMMLILIIGLVTANTIRVAASNPVDHLRSE